jgi:DNA helicase-2/ATP-dependent DNA helicase PcrA
MQNLIQGLNAAQQEAVLATEGPVLIVAGAGAGKTKTLTHRIGHLIEKNVPAEAILAITFTNKAAKEMRERVLRLLGKETEGNMWSRHRGTPFIGTFHGLGIYILREKGEAIGIPRSATILDADDSIKLIKRAMAKAGIDPKQFEPRRIQSIISRHKGNMGTAENIEEKIQNRYLAQTAKRVFMIYEQSLREANVLDFDDLLEKTVKLLETHPEIRTYYQTQWQYVHVDEYQDTNAVQYRLVQLLVGERKNICVVGDSDQNIYSWRGASIANILNFEEDYPGAKVVLLEENYRSTQKILKAANNVISRNTMRKKKTLFTSNAEGDQLSLFASYDETDEARYVATKIAMLQSRGVDPRAVAILYRTNFQSRVLEEALLYAGIPYQVLGVRFYERKEVKDTVSYLRAALNPSAQLDLERVINVPARGIGKVTLEKVLRGDLKNLPKTMQLKVEAFYALLARINKTAHEVRPSQLMAYIIKETGIENSLSDGDDEDTERLANVRELVTVAMRYDAFEGMDGIEQFLADVALESDQDTIKDKQNAVRLMTVHAAKGLEFDHVFITGMEQDLFPSKRAMDENKDISEREEERRLFYVALTRAAKKVFLSYASFRTIFGQRNVNIPSEFIGDIDAALIAEEDREGGVMDRSAKKPKVSLLGDDDLSDGFGRFVYV